MRTSRRSSSRPLSPPRTPAFSSTRASTCRAFPGPFSRISRRDSIVQGGSTITQQVAKSLFLSPEKSYIRKIREALLAYKIDHYLTKEEILTLYLNHIYLGHGTYGIEAASQGYFGKSAQISDPSGSGAAGRSAQSAQQLFSLPAYGKSPPETGLRPGKNGGRRVHYGAGEKPGLAVPVRLRSIRPKEKVAPYFIEHVRRYIQEKYGSDVLYKEGLEVYTTLNIPMQKAARDAVERGLQELEDPGRIYLRTGSGRASVHGGQNRRHPGDGRGPRFRQK